MPEIKCDQPGCDYVAKDKPHLGLHKRTAHGIKGTSRTALIRRGEIEPNGKLRCDQPGCKARLKTAQSLGRHKRIAHGIAGQSRQAQLKREANLNGTSNGSAPDQFQVHVAYLFGSVRREIEDYAESIGLPGPALTNRVAELLQRSARRAISGALHHLSPMQEKATR